MVASVSMVWELLSSVQSNRLTHLGGGGLGQARVSDREKYGQGEEDSDGRGVACDHGFIPLLRRDRSRFSILYNYPPKSMPRFLRGTGLGTCLAARAAMPRNCRVRRLASFLAFGNWSRPGRCTFKLLASKEVDSSKETLVWLRLAPAEITRATPQREAAVSKARRCATAAKRNVPMMTAPPEWTGGDSLCTCKRASRHPI